MDRRNLFCSLFDLSSVFCYCFVRLLLRVCCCYCLAGFFVVVCCLLFAVFMCDSKNLFCLFTFRTCFVVVVVVRLIGCFAAAVFLLF